MLVNGSIFKAKIVRRKTHTHTHTHIHTHTHMLLYSPLLSTTSVQKKNIAFLDRSKIIWGKGGVRS